MPLSVLRTIVWSNAKPTYVCSSEIWWTNPPHVRPAVLPAGNTCRLASCKRLDRTRTVSSYSVLICKLQTHTGLLLEWKWLHYSLVSGKGSYLHSDSLSIPEQDGYIWQVLLLDMECLSIYSNQKYNSGYDMQAILYTGTNAAPIHVYIHMHSKRHWRFICFWIGGRYMEFILKKVFSKHMFSHKMVDNQVQ